MNNRYLMTIGAAILWLGIIFMVFGGERKPMYPETNEMVPNCKKAQIMWLPMTEGNYQFRIVCMERNNVDD